MAIDVVVVNYRTNDLLRDFIRSYEESSFDGCTLTVMDVDPPGYPYHYLVIGENVRSIPMEGNVGYGKACNLGASDGTNDVILLANADTVLNKYAFRECYDALMAHSYRGVLGPRQVNEHNQITAGGIIGTDRIPRQRGWMANDVGQFNDVNEDVLSVSGALYFVKRSVWQELTSCPVFQGFQPGSLGAFLETKLYYEETFCSYHARAHGYKCVYYGPAQMIHYWHRSVNLPGAWGEQHMGISLDLFRTACKLHGIICE